MKQAAQPYFHFNGNCREAMGFYKELFGGELELMPVGESPMKEQFPEEVRTQIMHATLRNGDFTIMASDMCGMGEVKHGNSVNTSLNCTSGEEIRHLYAQLSE